MISHTPNVHRWSQSAAGLLLIAVLLMLPSACGWGQSVVESYGKRFLVAFPDTTSARIGAFSPPLREDARITFFANDTALVTITAPGYSRSLTVYPDASVTISLLDSTSPNRPLPRPFLDIPDSVLPDVLTITSDRPVSLLCQFVTRSGSEAFVPLPTDGWGTEYFAMSLRNQLFYHAGFRGSNEEDVYPDDAPGEIIIIASEDATDVTVNATTVVNQSRDTTFRLNAGEAYLIETARPWNLDTVARDLSGTRIRATRPIGVITGNSRTQGGFGANVLRTPTGNSANSSAVEWLLPASAHGNTFVYRPLFPYQPLTTQEIIRIYATSPGTTSVTASNGFPVRVLQQGEYAQFSYSASVDSSPTQGSFSTPFALVADKPASAMVVSGSLVELGDPLSDGSYSFRGWAPSMSLLPSREGWITSARFHAPTWPSFIEHYLALTADSGTRVWVDTSEVIFDSVAVIGTPFRHARLRVSAGDHILRGVGGRFGAVLLGTSRGSEEFRPPATRKKDERSLLHPSFYMETMSIGYAYPIYGLNEAVLPPDSLEMSRLEKCDSATVTIRRIGPSWTLGPLSLTIDPASVNTDVAITTDQVRGVTTGYRIRFAPRNPALDASGNVRITNPAGRSWEIPYSYYARSLRIDPDPVVMLDVPLGTERTIPLRFTNQRGLNVTLLAMNLTGKPTGFSLQGLGVLPRALLPGQNVGVTLAFTGTVRNSDYYDTLTIFSDCHRWLVPLHARVGPDPIPVITGYDWRERRVWSNNDTLSFITNRGSREFVTGSIRLTDTLGTDGAFQLIDPDWRLIDTVLPGDAPHPAGIRFTPPHSGEYFGTIELITTEGDTARGALHGVAPYASIGVPDLSLGTICLTDTTEEILFTTNIGAAAVVIDSLVIIASPTVIVTVDTIAPLLGTTLLPGERLAIPLRLIPITTGAFTVTIDVGGNPGGDTLGVIRGMVSSCISPRIVVDDHDFDSLFITLSRPGTVTLRNLGGGDVVVRSMKLVGDTAAAFTLVGRALPFTVANNDTVQIACGFSPRTIGLKTARIEFGTDVGRLESHLRGVGKKLLVPARIARDYHARPGEERTIYIELEGDLDTLPVGRLAMAVSYNTGLLDYLAFGVPQGADSGWRYFAARDLDTIYCTIDLAGRPPHATKKLCAMRFLTRLSTIDSTEFPFTITTDLPYVEVITFPGLFVRDPICGLEERLFEMSAYRFRLDEIVPNPLVGSGTITFEIPFENPTTLIVYDVIGNEVLRLIDGTLKSGTYTSVIEANRLPSGYYYYRVRSGPFTAIRRMIVP